MNEKQRLGKNLLAALASMIFSFVSWISWRALAVQDLHAGGIKPLAYSSLFIVGIVVVVTIMTTKMTPLLRGFFQSVTETFQELKVNFKRSPLNAFARSAFWVGSTISFLGVIYLLVNTMIEVFQTEQYLNLTENLTTKNVSAFSVEFARHLAGGAFFTYVISFWLVFLCTVVDFVNLFSFYRDMSRRSPATAAVATYAILGLLGTWALSLPVAHHNASNADILSSMFISFSALTTTGLSNIDVVTHWNVFGQSIIMLLILSGGFGIFIFWALITTASRRFSIKPVGNPELVNDEELLHFFQRTLAFFFLAMILGAAILFISDSFSGSLGQRIFHSIFHTISGFCNAGFSLVDTQLSFQGNYLYGGTISTLVVLGGLGPAVILCPKSRHARVTLRTSLFLIGFGALLIALLNLKNGNSHPILAIFQSISARTAGFSWFDFSTLPDATALWLMALMIIGASPGGTGGGVKVTLFFALYRAFQTLGKSLDIDTKKVQEYAVESMEAFVVLGFFAVLILISLLTITSIEGDEHRLLNLTFEIVSAISTTGLSKGITAELNPFTLFLLICLMVVGKVGPILLLQAVFKGKLDSDDFLERIEQNRVLIT